MTEGRRKPKKSRKGKPKSAGLGTFDCSKRFRPNRPNGMVPWDGKSVPFDGGKPRIGVVPMPTVPAHLPRRIPRASDFDWSDDQRMALERIEEWRRSPSKQTLTMGGYAGCGKTTVLAYLVNQWSGVAVCALCGKAASVLRSKGVDEAQTIHSLIYEPVDDYSGVRFERKPCLPGIRLIVVDEASMVNSEIYRDLLEFDIPVLFVGDHGQLEPIGDNPRLMDNPEIRLEKIHRQAATNPIIRLATAFRQRRNVPYWDDPEGRLCIRPAAEFESFVKPGVQFICGYNKTRRRINAAYRKLEGYECKIPCPGERVICLRNNRDFGVFNGQQFTVIAVHSDERDKLVEMEVRTDEGTKVFVSALARQFGVDLIDDRSKDYCLFDFGTCVTAHKSQGSEFAEVVALEEVSKSWDAARWRYTVVTRAKDRLVYCF